ncbi:hypothetical protein LCGC14_2807500 [marine sediment metagenome]|uniref:DUF547 domain-containing protein n=1 Tax=marine sediment metagenome TaxID=412755 RepID=A0A0F8YKV3_9ZZZZ
MKRGRLFKLVIGALILIVLILAGAIAYYEFTGGWKKFDEEFYLAPAPAEPFSYARYARPLSQHVDGNGMVNYAALSQNRSDLDTFTREIAGLAREEFDGWSDEAKLAFWINAYNALTLKVIVDNYPIQPGLVTGHAYPDNSIRQIPGVWTKIQFLVLGRRMTLDHMEHKIIRIQFDEPRIHMALVCAAVSCPPLRNEPYAAQTLNEQLDDQARRFLTSPANFHVDSSAGEVQLSSILSWFGKDFVGRHKPESGFADRSEAESAVLNFIGSYMAAGDAAYLRTGQYTLEYVDYNWSLNEQ